MSDHRRKARNTVEYLRIHPKIARQLARERRLTIEAPEPWPMEWVAQYVLRVALENGCTTIRVKQGRHASRDFDVMALVTLTRHMSGGFLPRPKMKLIPAKLATWSHRGVGNRLDSFKGDSQVSVPSLPSAQGDSSPLSSPSPVSSDPGR